MTIATSAAWKSAEPGRLLPSKPGDVDSAALVPLGTVAKFVHPTYGEGEFIYLLGVTSTVDGDPVTWNGTTYATTRGITGGGIPTGIAFARGAIVASKFGWYQISGLIETNKTKTVSMAAGIAVGISTAGLIVDSSSLKEIVGAKVGIVASATTTTLNGGKVVLNVRRGGANMQGRIT
jgi:hypothetical protein